MTSKVPASVLLGVPLRMRTAPPVRSIVTRDAIARPGVSGPPRYPVGSTTVPQAMGLPAGAAGGGTDAHPATMPYAASNGTSTIVLLVLMTPLSPDAASLADAGQQVLRPVPDRVPANVVDAGRPAPRGTHGRVVRVPRIPGLAGVQDDEVRGRLPGVEPGVLDLA